jgi:hypothetical protein
MLLRQLTIRFNSLRLKIIVNVLVPAGRFHFTFSPCLKPIKAVPIGANTEILLSFISAFSGTTKTSSINLSLVPSFTITLELSLTTSSGSSSFLTSVAFFNSSCSNAAFFQSKALTGLRPFK